MSIVLELQKEAMKSDKDILTILRMALVVATKLDLNDFVEWINNELKGYQTTDTIPIYRKVKGLIKYSNGSDGWQELRIENNNNEVLEHTIDVTNSIPNLSALDSKNPHCLLLNLTGETVTTLRNITGSNSDFYKTLSTTSSITDIIEQVRTIILEWSLMLEKNCVLGSDLTFTKDEIEIAKTNPEIINYINNAIINKNITNNQTPQNNYN